MPKLWKPESPGSHTLQQKKPPSEKPMHHNWRAARAPHTWGKGCRAVKTQQRQQKLQRKLEGILQIFFWAVMGFGFKGKPCSLRIKSMDTVNVYTLIFIYILIHGSWCWEICGRGELTPVKVMFWVPISRKTKHKKFTHTERLTLFIIHREKPSSMYTNLH